MAGLERNAKRHELLVECMHYAAAALVLAAFASGLAATVRFAAAATMLLTATA